MQAMRQKRSVTIPTKTAVKAMRRFPSRRSSVSVAPITRPRDQLIQVPRWTLYSMVEAAPVHAVWLVIVGKDGKGWRTTLGQRVFLSALGIRIFMTSAELFESRERAQTYLNYQEIQQRKFDVLKALCKVPAGSGGSTCLQVTR